jgi:hypothetical protein
MLSRWLNVFQGKPMRMNCEEVDGDVTRIH